MPIALQDGKVVLKEGKASCTCCEEEGCCMYPARAATLGDLLLEDLPETLRVRGRVVYRQGGTGVIPQDTTIYADANLNPDDGFQYITLQSTAWQITDSTYGLTGDDFILDADVVECLITGDGNMTPNDDWVEDQFEPTYSDGSNTLTRASSCEWSWTNITSASQVSWNETESKWQYTKIGPFFIPPWVYEHDGPQSSPAGTYTRIEGGPGGATTVTIL